MEEGGGAAAIHTSARQRQLGARMAAGLTTRSKKLLGLLAVLVGARALLGAPTLTTRRKMLLGAVLLGVRTLLGAPGLTTRRKLLYTLLAALLGARTLLGAVGRAARRYTGRARMPEPRTGQAQRFGRHIVTTWKAQ